MLDRQISRQTDSSVVNQNMCNLSILGIHVADSNMRVHLERAQGEKVQNLKEVPGQIWTFYWKMQLTVVVTALIIKFSLAGIGNKFAD